MSIISASIPTGVMAAPALSGPRGGPVPRLAHPQGLRALRVGMLLAAVAILNTVDLVYTLFADRIGREQGAAFQELNPIAESFLRADLRPSLICYKVLMLMCGMGLIWKLRGSRLAVPACWILMIAYSVLSIMWYMWVQDVTAVYEIHLSMPTIR